MNRLLEICVDDPAGLTAAVAGGADRIELCSALCVGGLTPSPGFVSLAVATGLPVHAMVRPRVGDFRYDDAEIAMIHDDIARLAAIGVAGVVVGVARADGSIDREALTHLRAAAPGCRAVLHRAIDLSPDPCAAIEEAVAAGFEFVLSSGGGAAAAAGSATLARMREVAGSRLTIIAGSGIDAGNVATLIRATGISQIHASASVAVDRRDPRIEALGFAVGQPRMTSAIRVSALKNAMIAA